MALLLSCREINLKFNEVTIFNNINFDIAAGDRIGLVGQNGAGKTTLANLIAGILKADSGKFHWHKKNLNTGYLKQDAAYTGSVSEAGDMKEYLYTTNTLGLKRVRDWDEEKLSCLSGGEKTKLAISRIWSSYPEFLILDEPTNHLDYDGVNWLLKELAKYKGTILIISHDRYFLDQCVTKIFELENGKLQEYCGNYSFYRDEKKRRYDSQLSQYYQQEKLKSRIDDQIQNLKSWSEKAHRDAPAKAAANGNKKGGKEFLRAKAKKMDIQIKSRIKRLEKIDIEGVEKPKEERKITFRLSSAVLKGNRVIEVSNLTKAYRDKVLLRDSSFYIQRGEKVGLFGPNGCGKTTLLKLLMGLEEPDCGTVFFSSSVRPGYLSQDIAQLDPGKKVLDFFEISTKEESLKIRTLLYQVGFDGTMLGQSLGSLSLGELTKLRIAGLINRECDLLLLDEPLNHLDLASREQLEQVLQDYNGTIVLVTHDRYMLERICDKLVVFENSKVRRTESGIKEYLESKNNSKANHDKGLQEDKLLIENEISFILGELCKYSPGSDAYTKLDQQFQDLIKKKKVIEQRKEL